MFAKSRTRKQKSIFFSSRRQSNDKKRRTGSNHNSVISKTGLSTMDMDEIDPDQNN